MLLGSDGEACVFGYTCRGIYLLNRLITALNTFNREDIVKISCDDSKLSGGYKAGKILHLEISASRGNVVASAVKHCHNRIIIRAKCTAWNTDFYALVDACGIE